MKKFESILIFKYYILIAIVFNFLNLFINNLKNRCSFAGKYKKIKGDNNQPKFLENINSYKNHEYLYYNDKYKKIENGKVLLKSFFKNDYFVKHKNSSSICKKLYLSKDISLAKCTGCAKKKFNKYNVQYKSFHNYYKIDNQYYYENTYFFDDGKISSALYKKYN